jgi:hypothetical protein
MNDILKYMGLSMEQWEVGFQTKQQLFEWVGTSSLFDPVRFRAEGQGIKKVKPERVMYAQFVQWVVDKKKHLGDLETVSLDKESQIQHALKYFGKKEEFDALAREDAEKAQLKESFNGAKVRSWTGLAVDEWKDLKATMDQVRSWAGGEQGILKILDEQGEDGIKKLVLRARDKVGIDRTEQEVVETAKALETVVITDT